jgi:hypothetical protein
MYLKSAQEFYTVALSPCWKDQSVRVRVTLRRSVGQSVSLGADPSDENFPEKFKSENFLENFLENFPFFL